MPEARIRASNTKGVVTQTKKADPSTIRPRSRSGAGEDPSDSSAPRRSSRVDIVLVDNRTVMREGVCALIEKQPDLVVVGQATSVGDAGSLGVRPHVVITEADLPDAKHGEVIKGLRAHFSETPILVLTLVAHPRKVQAVLSAGADGYLLKTATTNDLLAGIRSVATGDSYLQPSLGIDLARWHRPRSTTDALSPMEEEVLTWIALGHTNVEVARICHVSLRTVEAHRAHIQQKLGRRTRAELVEYVRELGIIEFDPP
jgi:two-component system response regulator NreC